MTYSLRMREPDGLRTRWWDNFTRTSRVEKFGTKMDFDANEWIAYRDALLKKHNAEYDGECVNFDTEQDAMFFILRWS